MKVFLDSTFFFPLIGIHEVSVDPQFIPELVKATHFRLYYSTITLFEMSAKGAKLILNEKLSATDVVDGLNSLRNWKEIRTIEPWSGEVQRLSFYFRKDHPNFIDCLILASAVIHSSILVSEDNQLRELVDYSWKKVISDVNTGFRILNSSEMTVIRKQ